MGKYDDIEPDRLRADLKRFAELLLRLEAEGGLLTSPSDLLTILGDLRQKLFAYEVRCSHLLGKGETARSPADTAASQDVDPSESLRVVREALRRQEEMIREWGASTDGETDDGG